MWSVDLDAIEPMLAAKTFRKQVKSLQFTFLENGTMASMKMIRKVDCAARTKVAMCGRTASKRQTRSGFTAAPGDPKRIATPRF